MTMICAVSGLCLMRGDNSDAEMYDSCKTYGAPQKRVLYCAYRKKGGVLC